MLGSDANADTGGLVALGGCTWGGCEANADMGGLVAVVACAAGGCSGGYNEAGPVLPLALGLLALAATPVSLTSGSGMLGCAANADTGGLVALGA